MSWWSDYPEKSIGRIIHFVYTYCGLNIAESIQVGEKEITLHNEKIADVLHWENFELDGVNVNIPIFKFHDDTYNNKQEKLKKYGAITLKEFVKKAGTRWMDIYIKTKKEKI